MKKEALASEIDKVSATIAAVSVPPTETIQDAGMSPFNPPRSVNYDGRQRTARAREARLRIAQDKQLRLLAEEQRKRSATDRLETAFGTVLDRTVGQIESQWVIDRYAELGIAAARQDDLSTVRAVLGDFMRHAQAMAEVNPDDRNVLIEAVTHFGPEAVREAGRRLGMAEFEEREEEPELGTLAEALYDEEQAEAARQYREENYPEEQRLVPRDAGPTPAQAELLQRLSGAKA